MRLSCLRQHSRSPPRRGARVRKRLPSRRLQSRSRRAVQRIRDSRRDPPAVRPARIPRRPGAEIVVQAFRRPFGHSRRAGWRALPCAQRQGLVAAWQHRLRRNASGRHDERRDGADARPRWPSACRARLVRHGIDDGRRRHALCGHRARASDRAFQLWQGRASRARLSDRGAAADADIASQQGHRGAGVRAQGPGARRHVSWRSRNVVSIRRATFSDS